MSDRYGELVIDGEQAVITFVRHLPYPIEAVWSAIADPDQRAVWFGETAIEGRVDGVIDKVTAGPPAPVEQKRMTGRILVWDPPHMLEHEWKQAIVEDGVVRYELARAGAGTVLTFSHRGLGVRNAKGIRLQAFKITIPATQNQPEPRTHGGYEWLFVLSERLRLVLADHGLTLGAGEVAEFDTRLPHWFGSTGRGSVEILSLFGRQGERLHVRAGPRIPGAAVLGAEESTADTKEPPLD